MRALLLLACTGCSTVLGIDDLSGPLADAAGDGATIEPDGPVVPPGNLLIAGTVLTLNLDGVPGAIVELVDQPAGIPTAETVSAADGTFALVIDTSGAQFDGAGLRVRSDMTSLATRVYFREALSPDRPITNVKLQVFGDTAIDELAQLCNLPPGIAKSMFVVFSVDSQGAPVLNVPFTTAPTATFCAERNGVFGPTEDTGTSGNAFAFELLPGEVTVSIGGETRSGRVDTSTVTEVLVTAP